MSASVRTFPGGDLCPCSSGLPYAECCGPLHSGEAAATALDLMRSRFSAYALALPDYLLSTWHPQTAPATVDLDDGIRWRRLQIVDTTAGRADDRTGVVEFRASFRQHTLGDGAPGQSDRGGHGIAGLVHERSRFERTGGLPEGRWLYLDGDQL